MRTRYRRTLGSALIVCAVSAITSACAVEGTDKLPELGVQSTALESTNVTIGSSCRTASGDFTPAIAQLVVFTRALAASAPFQQCVRDAINGHVVDGTGFSYGPYLGCNGDPAAPGGDMASYVVKILQGNNPLAIDCYEDLSMDGGRAKVSAITDVGTGTEHLSINVAGFNGFANDSKADFVSAILHEITHEHQFNHGPDEHTDSTSGYAIACGRLDTTNDGDSWTLKHTIPWIVTDCADMLASNAETACGGFMYQDGVPGSKFICGASSVRVPTHYTDHGVSDGESTGVPCMCAADPFAGRAPAPRSGDASDVPSANVIEYFAPQNGTSIVYNEWDEVSGWRHGPPVTVARTLSTATQIAAVSPQPGIHHLVFVAEDGSVGAASYNGFSWYSRVLTAPGFAAKRSPVAGVARGPTSITFALIDNSGNPNTITTDGTTWAIRTVNTLGEAKPGAGVALIARTTDTLDLFYPTSNGSLVDANWHNQFGLLFPTWGHAVITSQPGILSPFANLTAVARLSSTADVFFADNTGAIQQWTWVDVLGWSQTVVARNGASGSKLSAVSRAPDSIDVAWAGNGGFVYIARCASGAPRCAWTVDTAPKPFPMLASYDRPLSLVSRAGQNLDVFYQDAAGKEYTSYWTGASWASRAF